MIEKHSQEKYLSLCCHQFNFSPLLGCKHNRYNQAFWDVLQRDFVCSIPQLASSFEPPLLDTCITHKLLYNQNLFERPLSFSIALSISITIQFLFIYLFFPFRYVILFRSINNFQLMFYTFTFIEISKLCRVVTCIQYYDFSLNFYFTTSTLILNIIFEFF